MSPEEVRIENNSNINYNGLETVSIESSEARGERDLGSNNNAAEGVPIESSEERVGSNSNINDNATEVMMKHIRNREIFDILFFAYMLVAITTILPFTDQLIHGPYEMPILFFISWNINFFYTTIKKLMRRSDADIDEETDYKNMKTYFYWSVSLF